MATLTIVYWRDIPAQVIVKQNDQSAKRQLTDRFQEAIDTAAMRSKSFDSDAYLSEWRHGDSEPCGDDLEGEAEAAVTAIEAAYDEPRLRQLITSDGWDRS